MQLPDDSGDNSNKSEVFLVETSEGSRKKWPMEAIAPFIYSKRGTGEK